MLLIDAREQFDAVGKLSATFGENSKPSEGMGLDDEDNGVGMKFSFWPYLSSLQCAGLDESPCASFLDVVCTSHVSLKLVSALEPVLPVELQVIDDPLEFGLRPCIQS